MKYILIILILLTVSCTPIQAESEPIIETVIETVTETVIVTETITVEDTEKIEQLEGEVQQYRDLINNLNELLGYVYKIECTNDVGGTGGATAFAIEYDNQIYIISAGHLVENENGIFSNFKIKVNSNWIYPKLLDYVNGYTIDYAIFIDDNVKLGLKTNTEIIGQKFILGHSGLNLIKDFAMSDRVPGDSGSPIINLSGEVVGIVMTDGSFTEIDTVLGAIDNLK